MFQISDKLLLTLWVGAIWTVGYIVAPVLFNMLDKPVAGNVAGQLFTIVSYLGLVAGTFLIINILMRNSFSVSKQDWQFWLIIVMLFITVIGQFVLQPMMSELKAAGMQGENASRFGKLHGISSVLFLINSLAGLVLVISGLERKQPEKG